MINKFISLPFRGETAISVLSCMYPTYAIRSVLEFSDCSDDIIYVGQVDLNTRENLIKHTKSFICLTEISSDIALHTRQSLIEWVCENKKYRLKKAFFEILDSYNEEDFLTLFKAFWVSGKWLDDVPSSNGLYNLYASLVKLPKDVLAEYNNIKQPRYAIIPLLKHLAKVRNYKKLDGQKPSYLRLLAASNRIYGGKIQKSVISYLKIADKCDKDLALLRILLNLKS